MKRKEEEKTNGEDLESVKDDIQQNDNKVLGTLVSTEKLIWATGNYYGQDVVEAERILKKLPVFGTMKQRHDNTVVKEMLLIYSENQKANLLDNVMLEEGLTTMEVFYDGIQDMFNECNFHCMRLGTFKDNDGGKALEFDSRIPEYTAELKAVIQEASDEEIETFLKFTDFSFLNFFTKKIEEFQIFLPNLFKKLSKYRNFEAQSFTQQVARVLASTNLGIAEEIIKSIAEEMVDESKEEGIVGHVIGTSGDKVEILSKNVFDANRYPLLAIKCHQGTDVIGVVSSVEGKKILCRRVYALNDKDLVGDNISIMTGDVAEIINSNHLSLSLTPESSTKIKPVQIPLGFIIGSSEEIPKLDSEKMRDCLSKRMKGDNVSIPNEYNLMITPGELANGIIVGESGSGKSNSMKIIIVGTLLNNKFTTTRCALIVFDKEGEYSSLFQRLTSHLDFNDRIEIINAGMEDGGKFKIENLGLSYFVRESGADDPVTIFRNILRWIYDNEPITNVKSPKGYVKNKRYPKLNVEAL
ncbi:MAG: helicase HerA domain-containing protein, partial [Candidatus Hodarchaeota archaeon]